MFRMFRRGSNRNRNRNNNAGFAATETETRRCFVLHFQQSLRWQIAAGAAARSRICCDCKMLRAQHRSDGKMLRLQRPARMLQSQHAPMVNCCKSSGPLSIHNRSSTYPRTSTLFTVYMYYTCAHLLFAVICM